MGCYVRPIALVFTTRLMLKKKIEIGGPCRIRTDDLRIKRQDVDGYINRSPIRLRSQYIPPSKNPLRERPHPQFLGNGQRLVV